MAEPRRRILVIDSSLAYLDFMRLLLGQEYEVTTAVTPQEALQRLAPQPPDVIITEALFPGLAPFAVLDMLHAQAQTRQVPILLCTGAVQELRVVRERLQQEGIAILVKPFDIDALAACLTALIQRPRELQ